MEWTEVGWRKNTAIERDTWKEEKYDRRKMCMNWRCIRRIRLNYEKKTSKVPQNFFNNNTWMTMKIINTSPKWLLGLELSVQFADLYNSLFTCENFTWDTGCFLLAFETSWLPGAYYCREHDATWAPQPVRSLRHCRLFMWSDIIQQYVGQD